ncbi:MAG: hypothetical protein KJZ80_15370 [Hyphomicrobiaceae bacterium]|nr:hypothetical protein [Hyphomicrobiaceae bacterium]
MTRPWLAAIATAPLLAPAPAAAQSTGLDKIHAQGRVGGKSCMTSHEHYGEGSLQTRRGAELAAMRAWSTFTSWEYGKSWGSYAAAVGKKMDCSQSGGRWLCKTTARPCRVGP